MFQRAEGRAVLLVFTLLSVVYAAFYFYFLFYCFFLFLFFLVLLDKLFVLLCYRAYARYTLAFHLLDT